MKEILRNKTIAALLLLTMFVMVLGGLKVHWVLSALEWRDSELAGYEWLVPLGQYDLIYVAELDAGTYYRAGWQEETADGTVYHETVLDAAGRDVGNSIGDLRPFEVYAQMLEVEVHPAGCGIIEVKDASNQVTAYEVRDLEGELLYREKAEMLSGQLQLTEEPGYVISLTKNAVIDLSTGQTVFEAPENERILGQSGDFWQMELELLWYDNGDTLPVAYLRDMDFQVALGGKLSSGYSQVVQDGLIIGDVVINGTYYDWPEEVIMVEWVVMDRDGNSVEFPDADLSMITDIEDGFFCTVNKDENRRMHFTDDGSWMDLPENFRPVGPVLDEVFAVRQVENEYSNLKPFAYHNSARYGIMDRQGNVVAEPIFSLISPVRDGCAVVWYEEQIGILKVKGGGDDEA